MDDLFFAIVDKLKQNDPHAGDWILARRKDIIQSKKRDNESAAPGNLFQTVLSPLRLSFWKNTQKRIIDSRSQTPQKSEDEMRQDLVEHMRALEHAVYESYRLAIADYVETFEPDWLELSAAEHDYLKQDANLPANLAVNLDL